MGSKVVGFVQNTLKFIYKINYMNYIIVHTTHNKYTRN